jgi:lipopolysaccharide export system permease protein
MRIIKRLDVFLLKTFLPLFIMTFGICLFIFLMFFLWQYVSDMVGKGIGLDILAQLFFYAAMKFVPEALPLSILFAALMIFGSLGEQLELLAMKASGISLMRIMKPLTIFLIFIAIGAFFFQNNFIPVSQVKFYTLLGSVKQKSPELEIPEQTFYSQMKGQNIYANKKDKKKKLFRDVMIYDYSQGFNYARIIRADSGRLRVSEDKKYLILTLYHGESFENVKRDEKRAREAKDAVPYRRESFDLMEMVNEYDGNFNMQDESRYQDQYVGKDLRSLQHSIDSMTVRVDSIQHVESNALYNLSYKKTLAQHERIGAGGQTVEEDTIMTESAVDFDSLYNVQEQTIKASLLAYARRNIENIQMNYGIKSDVLRFQERVIRSHHAEMHKKFTLSFACLVFFFIGAPLGAIIRKGGLGTPAVISVFLYVFYLLINRMGEIMTRDGIWYPWQGMWLSTTVLLTLGIFLTYKAVNDSVIMNAETYIDALKRLVGKREYRKIEKKDIIMEHPDYGALVVRMKDLKVSCEDYLKKNKRWLHYFQFWKQGGLDLEAERIAREVDEVAEILKNSDQPLVLNKVMDFPIINSYRLVDFWISPKLGIAMAVFFPIGGLIYLPAVYRRKLLRQDIETTIRICDEMTGIVQERKLK